MGEIDFQILPTDFEVPSKNIKTKMFHTTEDVIFSETHSLFGLKMESISSE